MTPALQCWLGYLLAKANGDQAAAMQKLDELLTMVESDNAERSRNGRR